MSEHVVWALPSEYTAAAVAWLDKAIHNISRETHPILASVRTEQIGDLPQTVERPSNANEIEQAAFRKINVQYELVMDAEDVLYGRISSFLTQVFNSGETFGAQLEKEMLGHLSEITAASGQVVNIAGRDFRDALIDSLELADMSFDEEGNHNVMLVVSPTMAKKLSESEFTPEQQARADEIISRRWELWNASSRRQELP